MAHLDGKMKEDGVPFNSIEDQGMIQTGDDWKELRLDLDPRVRRMSGRMAVVWRVIKVDGERETRIFEILKIANISTPRYKLEIKRKFFTIFFFLSLECTPRSRFKRMIYRVERCRFDEQEKKSCKKLQCSPPVSTRIVKDDGHKRFLIRDRTYKYGRTSEEQIFQRVITLL